MATVALLALATVALASVAAIAVARTALALAVELLAVLALLGEVFARLARGFFAAWALLVA